MEHEALPELDQQYRDWYTCEATTYDHARFAGPNGQMFNTVQQQRIRQLLGLQPGQMVLDVPTGTGRIARDLASNHIRGVALDLTHAMLLQAQQQTVGVSGGEIMFVEGNAHALPFADAQFDAVIAIRFFHLLPTAFHAPFVDEMWRVLRPGGVLLIEYNSALAGGGLVWLREIYRRFWRGNKPRHYIWPQQINQFIPRNAYASVHGFSIFGGSVLWPVAPFVAHVLERLTRQGRASFLANPVFLRVQKIR